MIWGQGPSVHTQLPVCRMEDSFISRFETGRSAAYSEPVAHAKKYPEKENKDLHGQNEVFSAGLGILLTFSDAGHIK